MITKRLTAWNSLKRWWWINLALLRTNRELRREKSVTTFVHHDIRARFALIIIRKIAFRFDRVTSFEISDNSFQILWSCFQKTFLFFGSKTGQRQWRKIVVAFLDLWSIVSAREESSFSWRFRQVLSAYEHTRYELRSICFTNLIFQTRLSNLHNSYDCCT